MAIRINRRHLDDAELTFTATHMAYGTEDRLLVYQSQTGEQISIRPGGARRYGSVTCDVDLSIVADDEEWDVIADLHSHHVMGAFWSATDDANERLRGITFGVFSWAGGQDKWLFRCFDGTKFVGLSIEEVVADG